MDVKVYVLMYVRTYNQLQYFPILRMTEKREWSISRYE